MPFKVLLDVILPVWQQFADQVTDKCVCTCTYVLFLGCKLIIVVCVHPILKTGNMVCEHNMQQNTMSHAHVCTCLREFKESTFCR